MNFTRKSLILSLCVSIIRCSKLIRRKYPSSGDPCNPLYWYPRNIPDYCNMKTTESPYSLEIPLVPIPISFPQMSASPASSPLIPYGLSYPNPILPGYSRAFRPQIGMVPGLPGIVSRDGGINIMPFSDVYADMLEGHKNKMIRRKLQRVIDKYERRHRAYRRYY